MNMRYMQNPTQERIARLEEALALISQSLRDAFAQQACEAGMLEYDSWAASLQDPGATEYDSWAAAFSAQRGGRHG